MKQKKVLWFLVIFPFFCSLKADSFAQKPAGWTYLVYMQSDEELLYWALSALNNIALARQAEKINVCVQLQANNDVAWRYHIANGIIAIDEAIPVQNDCVQDVVNAMSWAVKTYPSEHYCLILWNHGFGILDPQYEKGEDNHFAWHAEKEELGTACESGVCPTKQLIIHDDHILHKGILFNFFDKTYMTNEKMVCALKYISKDVLKGKKVAVLGTDCCKMAMLEIGYQVKEYVDYLVGSQNCELRDGWDYYRLYNGVTSTMMPHDVVRTIVDSYGIYCQQHTKEELYTLSACDLNKINPLINDINEVAKLCKQYFVLQATFKERIMDARSRCVPICDAPFYTDLHSVYEEFLVEVEKEIKRKDLPLLHTLKKALIEGKKHIKTFVVANTTGKAVMRAQGISIYFPRYHIDSSYVKTAFAKETGWLDFLKTLVTE